MMNAKQGESPSMLRQRWLETAVKELIPFFHKQELEVPEKLRISVGWGHGNVEKILGQCWDMLASSDKHWELFIAPSMTDSTQIIGVIVHELIHATVGTKCGHKKEFKDAALKLGLKGKMTATVPDVPVEEFAEHFIKKHGTYPAGKLNKDHKSRKKQSTRLIKAECEKCGYTVRVTRKWIDEAGAPHCGVKAHGRMDTDYDGPEEEDGE